MALTYSFIIPNIMKTKPNKLAKLAILITFCLFFRQLYALESNCGDGIDNDGDGYIDMFDSDCASKSLGFACSDKFYLTRQITSPSNATVLSSINFVSSDINVGDNKTYSGLLLNASFYYDGFLYAFGHTPSSNSLYQLRSNGTTTSKTISGLPSSSWNNAVCTDSGMLYLLENGAHKLWKVNLKTLTANSISISGLSDSPGNSVWGDLVIDPTTQQLYCWYHPTATSSVRGLYKIDLSTNKFIFMGTNSNNTMGSLFFNSTGKLYGYGSATIGGVQDRFYTINKTNGATAQFGTPDMQVTQTDACNCATLASILPVELFDFYAKAQDDKTVLISWKTASEINNDYFDVKRSKDAVIWESIGRVEGNGFTQTISYYSFSDEIPYEGISYYMLTQVDFDKKSQNSPIVNVKMDSSKLETKDDVQVYPNPTKNDIWIKITNNAIDTEAQIYNTFGYNIFNKKLDNEIQSVSLNTFPNGIYLVIVGNRLFRILKE